MKVFYLGSSNKSKYGALKSALFKVLKNQSEFKIELTPVQPKRIQPIGRNETYEFAQERIQLLKEKISSQNAIFVAAEGGIELVNENPYTFGVVIIEDSLTKRKVTTETARCPIPRYMYESLIQNKDLELGSLIDQFANEKNTKQHKGAVGIFTNGIVTRKDLFEQALIIGLSLFLNPI